MCAGQETRTTAGLETGATRGVFCELVGGHELACDDGPGARQLAARGSHAKSRQDRAENDELGKAAGVRFGQYPPEKKKTTWAAVAAQTEP